MVGVLAGQPKGIGGPSGLVDGGAGHGSRCWVAASVWWLSNGGSALPGQSSAKDQLSSQGLPASWGWSAPSR